MNEYVNIKRQSVSHPPISVQTRALRFPLGEKIISGSRAAIFSPSVEQRAPRFTAFGPINDRLQTIRGIRDAEGYGDSIIVPSILRIASPLLAS